MITKGSRIGRPGIPRPGIPEVKVKDRMTGMTATGLTKAGALRKLEFKTGRKVNNPKYTIE